MPSTPNGAKSKQTDGKHPPIPTEIQAQLQALTGSASSKPAPIAPKPAPAMDIQSLLQTKPEAQQVSWLLFS